MFGGGDVWWRVCRCVVLFLVFIIFCMLYDDMSVELWC